MGVVSAGRNLHAGGWLDKDDHIRPARQHEALNEATSDPQFAQGGLLFGQPQRQFLLRAARLGRSQSNWQACPSKNTLGEKAKASDPRTIQFFQTQASANVSCGTSQEAMKRLFRLSRDHISNSSRAGVPRRSVRRDSSSTPPANHALPASLCLANTTASTR